MARAVGIDVGTEALRGVLIESRGGKLMLLSAGAAPLGEWAALEDNQDKRLAIGEKLKELVRDAGLRAPKRRIAATAKGNALRYLSVPPVPPWRLEMLAKYEIEERSDDKEPSAYDYRILDVPDIGGQYTVLLASMHERTVDWLMDISRQARLGEVEPDLKAIALYNAYYHGHGYDEDKTALIVDIGAEDVTVLVVRNGALYLARTFEGGGRRVSQALSEDLKATILEAEEIKKNEAEILFDVATGATGATTMFRRPPRLGGTTLQRRLGNGTKDPVQVTLRAGAEPAKPPVAAADAAGIGETPSEEQPAEAQPAPSAEQGDDSLVPTPSTDPTAPMVVDVEAEPEESGPRPMSAGDQKFLDELDDMQPAVKRRRQISQLLVRESAGLCAALESAVNYCRGQYKMRDLKVDVVYVAGAGSRLKGLSRLISRRLRAPVESLEVFRRLDLSRLPDEAAQTLRSEQDRMAVSTGAALSALCGGAFSFLIWPTVLKERKEFWARGAWLYYASAFMLATLAVFFLTPFRNAETLAQNEDRMNKAVQDAQLLEQELVFAKEEHEELQRRLEQIDLNAKSGAFFLKVLAELKDPNRIPQDVWLTSLSTNLPSVILKDTGSEKESAVSEPGAKAADSKGTGATPDTFQAQARVYLRGFVRSGQKGDLYSKIKGDRSKKPFIPGFSDLLVPHPEDPEHPRNLFRDIRPVWVETNDHPEQSRFLKEFVLEAYVEGTRDLGRQRTPRKVQAEEPARAPTAPEKKPDAQPAEATKPVELKPAVETKKAELPDPKATPVQKPAVKPAEKPAEKEAPKPATKEVVDPEAKAF